MTDLKVNEVSEEVTRMRPESLSVASGPGVEPLFSCLSFFLSSSLYQRQRNGYLFFFFFDHFGMSQSCAKCFSFM